MTVPELSQEVGIRMRSVEEVVHSELVVSKVSTRRVPRLLTTEQREGYSVAVTQLSQQYEREGSEFLDSVVTSEETWAHYLTPESKRASKQWQHADSPSSKKRENNFFSGADHCYCVPGFKRCPSPGLSRRPTNHRCTISLNSPELHSGAGSTLKVKKAAGFSSFPPRQRSSSHCCFNDGNSTETEVGCTASPSVQSGLLRLIVICLDPWRGFRGQETPK
jgi:hypothetical protein